MRARWRPGCRPSGWPAWTRPALERSAIGFIVNRRAELDRQAAQLEARLERLALEGSDLAGLLGAIGQALDRAVALEGRRGHPLAVHAPADVPGAAAAVAAYLARPRGVALRVSLPPPPPDPTGGDVSRRAGPGRSSGSLALIGDRPASELERVVTERIAPLLALELARDESVRRARDTTRRGESLPSEGPPWVVLLADQLAPGVADTLERREEARREIRLLATARRMALRGDAASLELRVVLAAGPHDPGGLELAARIARFLDRPVALSRPFADPTDRPAAEAEARSTLEAARGLVEPPAVARADRLRRLSPAGRSAQPARRCPPGPRAPRAAARRSPRRPGGSPRHPSGRPRPSRARRGGGDPGRPSQHGRLPGPADRDDHGLEPGRSRPPSRPRHRAPDRAICTRLRRARPRRSGWIDW